MYGFNSSSFTSVYILPNYAYLNNTDALEFIGKARSNGQSNNIRKEIVNEDREDMSFIENILNFFD